ncbi:hypothetical protein GCM10011579_000210 [Streptomyces albiflavescens]|uniref:Uncharacterized protein n=1 Tax=Streptomyces albiflavescens TaxID=1623582 RepID=A0A918CY89_9ACTN|nr:hypothetical protein [Streptomyces albiflavescens]GGN47988.1 hypothetical protein GCM10011579_000210 [Streptomyces albiflavescens]
MAGLPEPACEVRSALVVAAGEFTDDVLGAVGALPEYALRAAVKTLVGRELVVVRGTGTSSGTP